jgi:transglutaminase-like putative cysteine protease
MNNSIIKILVSICLLIALDSKAAYKPPITFEKTVDTYNVKKDGTNVLISENVILIETENGVRSDGEADIEYNSSFETVKILSAYTLQPDGKKILVKKDGIKTTDDPLSEGAPMFSDSKHKIIIFPNVKIGSRLCYTYETTAHEVAFKNNFMLPGFYSPHYKYVSHIININISKSLPVYIDKQGVDGGLVKKSQDQNHYQFTYSQTSVTPPEPGEVEAYDYSPYVVFSTFPDQVSIGREYQSKLAPKVKLTPEIQKLADELTDKVTNQREQVKILYNWVKNNIRYVAVYMGNGGWVPHTVSSILSNRYGDCKDHAAILEALLAAKGITSSGALINSGEAYKIPKYAVSAPQNHIITYVPSLDMYLDSTSKYTSFGMLPISDLDKPVILTALNKLGHTPKMRKEDYEINSEIKMKINADGSIDGFSRNYFKGSVASSYRSSRVAHAEEDSQTTINRILQSSGQTGTGVLTATDPLDTDKPFIVDAKFKLDPVSNFPGPAAMKIPMGVSVNLILDESQNKPIAKRFIPYVWYPNIYRESYVIEFPEKTRITRVPENMSFHKTDIQYDSTYRLERNKLYVTRTLIEDHKGEVVQPDEKTSFKEFIPLLQKDLRSQVFYE